MRKWENEEREREREVNIGWTHRNERVNQHVIH